MSVKALSWAFEQRAGDPTRKILLLSLADFADDKGHCWPSQAVLANIAECSTDTVSRQLRILEAEGYLKRRKRIRDDGGRSSDFYALSISKKRVKPPPAKCGIPPPHSYAAARTTTEVISTRKRDSRRVVGSGCARDDEVPA